MRRAPPCARSSPAEAELARERGAALVDVREASEWEQGHIAGARHVSKSYIEQEIEALAPDYAAPIVLYCAGGIRSLFAAQTLQAMGYADVASMSGGFQAWKAEGRSFEQPVVLSREQKQRYSRHLLIPEVGAEGQARLLGSKALFIGAGGLGSPAMLYLAAAGVGTLGIVDFDVVDVSNLQRQVVHTTDRVGVRRRPRRRRRRSRRSTPTCGSWRTMRCSPTTTWTGSSPATTSSSTAPTRSRRATRSTTRPCARASPSCTPRCSASRAS